MRIGLMGGTFDPIHLGHLLAAQAAKEAGGLDQVWFIPSYVPPLKGREPGADGVARLEMTMLATEAEPAFRVLPVEIERRGTSYSYDTVTQLKEIYPDARFTYIIGSDRVNDLHRWHRIEELAALVTFIGLARPGEPLPKRSELPAYLAERITFADMPQIELSSTDIRQRVAAGRPVRFMVPESVYSYIQRNGLYES